HFLTCVADRTDSPNLLTVRGFWPASRRRVAPGKRGQKCLAHCASEAFFRLQDTRPGHARCARERVEGRNVECRTDEAAARCARERVERRKPTASLLIYFLLSTFYFLASAASARSANIQNEVRLLLVYASSIHESSPPWRLSMNSTGPVAA